MTGRQYLELVLNGGQNLCQPRMLACCSMEARFERGPSVNRYGTTTRISGLSPKARVNLKRPRMGKFRNTEHPVKLKGGQTQETTLKTLQTQIPTNGSSLLAEASRLQCIDKAAAQTWLVRYVRVRTLKFASDMNPIGQ